MVSLWFGLRTVKRRSQLPVRRVEELVERVKWERERESTRKWGRRGRRASHVMRIMAPAMAKVAMKMAVRRRRKVVRGFAWGGGRW